MSVFALKRIVRFKQAMPLEDCEYVYRMRAHAIDDAVSLKKDFSNVGSLQLWYNTTGSWSGCSLPSTFAEALNPLSSTGGIVPRDIPPDCQEVPPCSVCPAEFHVTSRILALRQSRR